MFIKIQMPYGTSNQKKKELMSELTNTAAQIMDMPAESISIMIDDRFDYTNWMMGGQQDNFLSSLKEALDFTKIECEDSDTKSKKINEQEHIRRTEIAKIAKIASQLRGYQDNKEEEDFANQLEKEDAHDKAFDMEVITEVVAQTVDEMVRTSKILADKMSEALKKYSEK